MSASKLTLESIGNYTIGVRSNTFNPHKESVVLVHGIGVSSAYFVPLAKELEQNFNVFALDLPGYGTTPKPKKALSIPQLATVVHSFLIAHNLKQSTIVGHSMGCQIIAHLRDIRDGSIAKLILLAPTVNKNERSIVMQGVRLFQDTFRESPAANFVIFKEYAKMGPFRYLKTSRLMVRDIIETTLEKGTLPTLIVTGEKDPIVPNKWAHFLSQSSPNVTHKEIRGVPHAFHFSNPEKTAVVCEAFIKS